jgi:hypothetical protein
VVDERLRMCRFVSALPTGRISPLFALPATTTFSYAVIGVAVAWVVPVAVTLTGWKDVLAPPVGSVRGKAIAWAPERLCDRLETERATDEAGDRGGRAVDQQGDECIVGRIVEAEFQLRVAESVVRAIDDGGVMTVIMLISIV